jgi:ABC-type transport system involved in multi-copper enzyme maturation permease subunit
MIKLLKIDFKKILGYKTFWILTGIYAFLTFLIFFGIQGLIDYHTDDINSNSPIPLPSLSLYNMPDIWHNLTYIGGWTKLILGVIVIILITNEYSYKTIRQNVINGMSRWDFLLSKLLTIGILSASTALLVFLIGLILGITHTESLSLAVIFEKTEFILAYFLELCTFMVFALFIGLLVKRSGLAIGLLLIDFYILEPILGYVLPWDIGDYLPREVYGSLIGMPNNQILGMVGIKYQDFISFTDVLMVLGYLVLFGGLSYWILKRRDL